MRKVFAVWLLAGLPALADSVAATRAWVSNRVAEARAEWRADVASATNPVPSWISAAEGRAAAELASATNAVSGRIGALAAGLDSATGGLWTAVGDVEEGLDSSTNSLWGAVGELRGATADLGSFARTNDIPVRTSQLVNDSGFTTNLVDMSDLARASGLFPDWASRGGWTAGEFCTWRGRVYRFTGVGDPSAQPDVSPVSWAVGDAGTAIAEAAAASTNPVPSWIAAATNGLPAKVSAIVESMVSGLDGTAATRLVGADGTQWIDGTGAVWRVARRAVWNGGAADAPLGAASFAGDGWELAWTGDGSGVTGSWDLYRTLSPNGPLVAHFTATGLPFQEGMPVPLGILECTLAGSPVSPGSVRDDGWYQIPDSVGAQHFVSPLVTTALVVRVTNHVDRLALAGEIPSGDDVRGIVTAEVQDGWIVTTNGVPAPGATVEYTFGDGTVAVELFLDGVPVCELASGDFAVTNETSLGITVDSVYNDGYTYLIGASVAAEKRFRNALGLARLSDISASNPTFSDAVLSVGLNIDTNSVAVLGEIADAFGGFPIEGTATTVGGLLAALAAAIAWLKRNKADKTDLEGFATIEDLLAFYYPDGNVTSMSQITTSGIEYAVGEDGGAYVVKGNGLTGHVVLPWKVTIGGNEYKVTAIGESAFNTDTSPNNSFAKISAPITVKSVGRLAFIHYGVLHHASFPAATSIGEDAFFDCATFASISMPSVASIGKRSFYSCISLASVSMPSVTSVGVNAFAYCSSLASVSMPSVTSVGVNAFVYCTSLSSVSVPSVASIGDGAFNFCGSLASINLPSVTSIGNGAFSNCTSLTTIDFGPSPKSAVPSLSGFAFGIVPTSCKFIIPLGMYNEWIAASGWSDLYAQGYKFEGYASTAQLANKADKATTLAGYGITDGATKTELNAKADKSALAAKADKATTLAGYGITDAETKGVAIPKYEFVNASIADGVLTVAPYTNAQITSDGTAFTVAVAEGDGKARDCQFTLDCTSLEIAPTITWGANFRPRTDAETDFACVAGKRNVYWVTEYAPNEFAVAGWQVMDGGGTSGGAA